MGVKRYNIRRCRTKRRIHENKVSEAQILRPECLSMPESDTYYRLFYIRCSTSILLYLCLLNRNNGIPSVCNVAYKRININEE